MSLFSIPDAAVVQAAFAKRSAGRPGRPGRPTGRKPAPRPATRPADKLVRDLEAELSSLDLELSRAEWRAWQPTAVVAHFVRWTCVGCNTPYIQPSSRLLVRWQRADDPTRQWYVEAHDTLSRDHIASLPRETQWLEAEGRVCPICWPDAQTCPGQLDLFGAPESPDLPEHVHPSAERQRELDLILDQRADVRHRLRKARLKAGTTASPTADRAAASNLGWEDL